MAIGKGSSVKITTATQYGGAHLGVAIPQWVKNGGPYTVSQANSPHQGYALLQPINSWVPISGLEEVPVPAATPPTPAPAPKPAAAPAPTPVVIPSAPPPPNPRPPEPGLGFAGILNGTDTTPITGSIDRIELFNHVRPSGEDSIKFNLEKINRFRYRYPDQELENTIGHVFLSRPNLNLFESDGIIDGQVRTVDYFIDLYNSIHGIKILQSLCAPKAGGGLPGPFIYLLHNYAENFEMPDKNIKTTQSAQSRSGYSISMGGKYEIPEGPTTSIKYTDDRKLSVFKLHKAWVDYIHLVTIGTFKAKEGYRLKKELDYACSAYCFLCAEDGFTILYWAKYTGIFPINIPSSQFGWQKGNFNKPELTIEYKYTGVPDVMRPVILSDFNNISSKHGALNSSTKARSIYDESTYSMFDPWYTTPVVVYNKQRDTYELHMA